MNLAYIFYNIYINDIFKLINEFITFHTYLQIQVHTFFSRFTKIYNIIYSSTQKVFTNFQYLSFTKNVCRSGKGSLDKLLFQN